MVFANFNKAFFNEKETESKIPKEVLNTLSENLPNGFVYTELEHGMLGITPQESDIKVGGFKFDLKDKVFNEFKEFTPSNVNEIIEFLYRTQRKYEIELNDEDPIIINGETFKVGEIIEMPFEELKKAKHKLVIIPQPFNPPFEIELEGNNVIKKFIVERQPFADMNKMLFKSINNKEFEISYIIEELKQKLQFNFKMNIDNTTDVIETIDILKLYHACITGDIKLNGVKLSDSRINHPSEEKTVVDMIKFWEKVKKIQDTLNVKFKPKSQIEMEDLELIEKLYRTLVEGKPFRENININEMTLTGTNEMNFKDLLDKEGLSISFQQDTKIEIFGVNLELYSIVSFFDLKVKSFKPLNEQSYVLDIEPIKGRKVYQSTIHFCGRTELKTYKMDITELQKAEVITIN